MRSTCFLTTILALTWINVGLAQAPGDDKQDSLGEESNRSATSDVEMLLHVRDAERNLDRLMLEATEPGSIRIKPKFAPGKIESLTTATDALLEQLETVIKSERMTGLRREQAKIKKLSVLYTATRINQIRYEPIFDEFCSTLLADATQGNNENRETTGLVTAYQLRHRYVDTEKPTADVRSQLDIFAEEYKRTPYPFMLFMCRAENLMEADDIAGALEVLRHMEELFAGNAQLPIIRSIAKRLEMIGQPVEIVAPLLEGGEFNLAEYKGKVVLIYCWASWCGPCTKSFPKIQNLASRYESSGLAVVGFSLDGSKAEAQSALDKQPISWKNILFEGESVGFQSPLATQFSITAVPNYLLISKDGVFLGSEYTNATVLEQAIVKALGLSAPIAAPDDSEIVAPPSN